MHPLKSAQKGLKPWDWHQNGQNANTSNVGLKSTSNPLSGPMENVKPHTGGLLKEPSMELTGTRSSASSGKPMMDPRTSASRPQPSEMTIFTTKCSSLSDLHLAYICSLFVSTLTFFEMRNATLIIDGLWEKHKRHKSTCKILSTSHANSFWARSSVLLLP